MPDCFHSPTDRVYHRTRKTYATVVSAQIDPRTGHEWIWVKWDDVTGFDRCRACEFNLAPKDEAEETDVLWFDYLSQYDELADHESA